MTGCLKPHPDAAADPKPKPKPSKQPNPPELLRSDALHIWPYNSGVVIASPVASSMAGEDDGGLDAAVILPLRCVLRCFTSDCSGLFESARLGSVSARSELRAC